jgi:NAD(P)-dependent dehydrogenase (short-subunit alcohol dehydrogenase family)
VVAELDKAGAERTAGEVKAAGRRAVALTTDVTRRTDLESMAARTLADLGKIDILVNNAGIYRAAATLEITEEHWDAVLDINAKALFFACQAVLPAMIKRKRGCIVNLASMAGKVGSRTNLPYNASKAAVVSITKSLALAHAEHGIRVNCVCPGFVETDMWNMVAREQGKLLGLSPEEFTRQRKAQVPLGRMEKAEDVAMSSASSPPSARLHDRSGAERDRRPRHALTRVRPRARLARRPNARVAPSAARPAPDPAPPPGSRPPRAPRRSPPGP